MWRRDPEPREPERPEQRSPNVTDEFDSYLAGTYAGWLMRRRQSVPAWAWVNQLAHGTVAELDELRSGVFPPTDPEVDVSLWQQVLTFLATEVLDRAENDDELRELQRAVLIPVELRLVDQWWYALAPIDIATIVLVALHNVPHHQ
jgi:hypothetical protein